MLDELLTEVVAVDVRVDFCGGDVFVSQHLLYGAQVGTAFQQVGGEAVAKGVWRNVFVDARRLGVAFDVVEHRDARKVLAPPMRNEDVVLFARFRAELLALCKPKFQLSK